MFNKKLKWFRSLDAVRSQHNQRVESLVDKQELHEVSPNLNQWNDWGTETPKTTLEHNDVEVQCNIDADENQFKNLHHHMNINRSNSVNNVEERERSINDWNDQFSPIQSSEADSVFEQISGSVVSNVDLIPVLQSKIQQILLDHGQRIRSSRTVTDDLDQLILLLNKYQEEIEELQK